MRIVCQQTILMKYHALFVIFEKSGKILNCCLLQNIGGVLRSKVCKRKFWNTVQRKGVLCFFIRLRLQFTGHN